MAKKVDQDKVKKATGVAVAATAAGAAYAAGKKKKKLFIALAIILVVIVVAAVIYGYYHGWFDAILHPQTETPIGGTGGDGTGGDGAGGGGTVADMKIYFLELGNQYTGDCVYIKAGDVDILIDAGSRGASASTICKFVDQYCKDGVLEYVIATHAHQDHIEGFVGTSTVKGVLDYYKVETLIKYVRTNATSNVSKNFANKVTEVQSKGTNVYTAAECVENTNGAQKVYEITDGITMEILDQRFYHEKASDENDYSVCTLFTHGDNHYLFTGDLEEKGETSLVELNPDLPQVELYKGGHHGSYTAGNEVLLSKIQPKNICICCCAGNVEYLTGSTYDKQNLSHSFPAQEFINRIAQYTDSVYVTTRGFIKDNGKKWVNDGCESMNGNITFSCISGIIEIHGSNNDLKLKDTEWFKNNRDCPEAWK